MAWEIELKYIKDWLDKQDEETINYVFTALDLLRDRGPTLGRPLVDTLSGVGGICRNLKELRPPSPDASEIRILFAFDPRRKAIMLVAGDKSQGKAKWGGWYRRAVPKALAIYARHLAEIGASK